MSDLFDECVPQEPEKKSIVDKLESDFKKTFVISDEQADRNSEKKKIKSELSKLRKELLSIKNVKNHRRTEVNCAASEKRRIIRKKIQDLEERLEDIKDEEDACATSLKKFAK